MTDSLKGLELHTDMQSGEVKFERYHQFTRINSEATASFFDMQTNRGVGDPFVITQRDIPGLDFLNPEQIEEIFGKYGDYFERLEQVDRAKLAETVFIDIVQRRKQEKDQPA